MSNKSSSFVSKISVFVVLCLFILPNLALASSQILLREGTFVLTGTACGRASNATIIWFDGISFSGGRMPKMTPRATTVRGQFKGQAMDFQDEQPFDVTITILSHEAFTWKAPWGRNSYRFCPASSVPASWRLRSN